MIRAIDSVFGAMIAVLAAAVAATIFLPLITTPPAAAAPIQPIVLDIPPFIDSINFTNPQIITDCAGVVWAATRASSGMGGVVWRVNDYQDADHRGTPLLVNVIDPTVFFANGELIVWPNGYLYYVSVEIDNLVQRTPQAQFAVPVPGWSATSVTDGSCLRP